MAAWATPGSAVDVLAPLRGLWTKLRQLPGDQRCERKWWPHNHRSNCSPTARLVAEQWLERSHECLGRFGIKRLQRWAWHSAIAAQHSQCRLDAAARFELLSQPCNPFLRAARLDQPVSAAALIELAAQLRRDTGK